MLPQVFERKVGGAWTDEVGFAIGFWADGADAEPLFVHVFFGGGVVSICGVVPATDGVVGAEVVLLSLFPPFVGPLEVQSAEAITAATVFHRITVDVAPVAMNDFRLRELFFFSCGGVVSIAAGFHEDDGFIEGCFDLVEEVGEGGTAIGINPNEVDVGTEFSDEVEVLQVAINDADGVVGIEFFDLHCDFVEEGVKVARFGGLAFVLREVFDSGGDPFQSIVVLVAEGVAEEARDFAVFGD